MSTPQKILIAESDIHYARTLRDSLRSAFPEIRVCFDSHSLSREIGTFSPDIVVADAASLGGAKPDALCREIRGFSSVPLLLLAGRTPANDKVRAFSAGADDFLEKPLDTRELAARMLAVWRRYEMQPPARQAVQAAPESVAYPQLFISLSNYTVLCNGVKIDMAPRELELLFFLASSPNQVFTREQLLDNLWGYDSAVETRTVDVHIKRIRKKIKDHETWSLDTVWGVGYKFRVTSTQTASGAPQAASAQTDSGAAPHTK